MNLVLEQFKYVFKRKVFLVGEKEMVLDMSIKRIYSAVGQLQPVTFVRAVDNKTVARSGLVYAVHSPSNLPHTILQGAGCVKANFYLNHSISSLINFALKFHHLISYILYPLPNIVPTTSSLVPSTRISFLLEENRGRTRCLLKNFTTMYIKGDMHLITLNISSK